MVRTWVGVAVVGFAVCGVAWAADDEKPAKPAEGKVDLVTLFKKLDTNADGQISPDEFKKLEEFYKPEAKAAPAARRLGGAAGKIDPEKLKQIKEKIATGQIDPEKLKQIREKLGKGVAKPENP